MLLISEINVAVTLFVGEELREVRGLAMVKSIMSLRPAGWNGYPADVLPIGQPITLSTSKICQNSASLLTLFME
jgi:hypothetical protein